MNKAQMNLQDNFLNQVRKEGILVTIYLVSGVQLKGLVRGFDSFTVMLETPGKPSQLVYKHAMASVVPARPVYLQPREEGGEERAQSPRPAPAQAQAPRPAPASAPAPAPAAPVPAPQPIAPPAEPAEQESQE